MTQRSDRDWAQTARRTLTTICALGAVTASFIFLTDLARLNGWPYWAALLLPLCIDALGGMALLQYRINIKGAGWVAAGAIAASFIGNGLSHLYATGVMTPGWVSIALIGGVPALSLGLCFHLNTRKKDTTGGTKLLAQPAAVPDPVVRGGAGDGDQHPTSRGAALPPAPHPNSSQTRNATPVSRSRTPARRKGNGTRGPNGPSVDELVDHLHREWMSEEQLMARFRVGHTKAKKARDLVAANNGAGDPA